MIKILLIIATTIISTSTLAEVPNNVEDINNTQWLLNIAFTMIGSLGGWLMHILQNSMKEAQKAVLELSDKVHTMDVLVAGQYVRKDDLEKLSNALFSKLDKIDQKLDKKADKE